MAKRSSRPSPNRKKTVKTTPGPVAVTVLLLICAVSVVSVATWERYTFAETDLFPLWYVAIGAGLLGGVLFVLKFVGKEHGAAKRVGMLLLMSLLCFFAAGTMLAHANHLFDQSEPVRYTVVIEDKEYRAGGKGPSHREFTVTVEGETFDIDVPRKDYKAFDVGDFYVIEYREGALGEPYYMAIGGVDEDTDRPYLNHSCKRPALGVRAGFLLSFFIFPPARGRTVRTSPRCGRRRIFRRGDGGGCGSDPFPRSLPRE